jgi:mycothiol synthase
MDDRSLPLPRGYRTRALRDDDATRVADLVAATEIDVDGMAEIDISDVRGDWDRPGFNLATMTIGVEQEAQLVAFAETYRGRADVEVHPSHRGNGIGTALMGWTWETARRQGRDSVGQIVSDAHTTAVALFRSNGYEVGHTSWILRIDLDEEVPPPVLPDGLAIRDWRPGEDDREIWRVIEEAFSEWPGRDEQTPFEDWKASVADHPAVRSDTTPVVADGDRIVGVAVGMDYQESTYDEGWIQQLAVHRDYRKVGLGKALLTESFRRFRALGHHRAGLSTDSRTGALRIYEHVGMRVARSYTYWSKQLGGANVPVGFGSSAPGRLG